MEFIEALNALTWTGIVALAIIALTVCYIIKKMAE